MVKIIIHIVFVVLLLISIGINVAFFTERRYSPEYVNTKDTIEQLTKSNTELRRTEKELRATVERLEAERQEIDRRLEESIEQLGNSIESGKGFILDAIESNRRIGEAASKLGD